MPKLSELTALPKKVPIDWFDPIYWNNLSIHEHAQYIKNGTYVALPSVELCTTWDECEKWKNMPEKEFMAKYGDAVQAEYKVPMADELEQLEQQDEEDEVEEELDVSGEGSGDE
jgi:hypothetical protein